MFDTLQVLSGEAVLSVLATCARRVAAASGALVKLAAAFTAETVLTNLALLVCDANVVSFDADDEVEAKIDSGFVLPDHVAFCRACTRKISRLYRSTSYAANV